MNHCITRDRSPKLAALLAAALLSLTAQPARAADEPTPPEGPAVTVLKAAKSCFYNIVEVSGMIIAREETSVRPERPGLKVTEVLAEAGDTITAGQVLARLTLPEGGSFRSGAGGGVDLHLHGADRRHRRGQGRGAVHHRRAQRI